MDSSQRSDPFRKRLTAFAGELEGVGRGDVESLHRARVASRRLRELLPLLELDRDVTRHLTRRLRKVTKQLGIVRELDVVILTIQGLAASSRYSARALTLLRASATKARGTARERLSATLPTAKLKRLTRRLERVSGSLDAAATSSRRDAVGSARAWLWAVEARVARRAAAVRAAVDVAGAIYVPEQLHRVRIATKKLRYAAELTVTSTRKQIPSDLAALKEVQDLLGRLHDLQNLVDRARQAQVSLSPPDLTAWRDLGSLMHVVEDDCRQLHARYMRDRAHLTAIASRMGARAGETQLGVRRAAV